MNPNIVNAWGFFFDLYTITIRKDSEGRYCLNDLHKAAGELEQHATWRFFRNQQTDELIEELIKAPNLVVKAAPLEVKRGRNGGTFVVKELVYAYAMWISPAFHLKVIRVFDEYATKGMVMKPEVAQQAFDDPKVFMAKALMLAQETLEKYAQEIAYAYAMWMRVVTACGKNVW